MLLVNFTFNKILDDRNMFEFHIDINKFVLIYNGFRLITLGDQRERRRAKNLRVETKDKPFFSVRQYPFADSVQRHSYLQIGDELCDCATMSRNLGVNSLKNCDFINQFSQLRSPQNTSRAVSSHRKRVNMKMCTHKAECDSQAECGNCQIFL